MHYVGHFIVLMMKQMLFGVSPQIMRCIFCCSNYIFALNSSTKERKGMIKYYKTYGITILKKHLDANHSINSKKIKEEVNNVGSVEKQLAKKKPNVSIHVICNIIVMKDLFKKMMCGKKLCIRPSLFDCEKSHAFLASGECLVKHFVLHSCPQMVFLSKDKIFNKYYLT